MKLLYVFLIYLVYTQSALAASALPKNTDEPCRLVVRFENYAKHSGADNNLTWHGLDVDFAKALLDQAQCSYSFVSVPWGRALKMLELGEIDMMLSVSQSAQRAKFANFIGPQRNETIVLVTHKSRPYQLNNLSQLLALPAPIAIHKHAFYGERVNKMVAEHASSNKHFIVIADNKLRMSLLRHGRLSGFFAEKYNMQYQKAHNPEYMQVEVNPLIINKEPVYFALSKKSVDEQLLIRLEKAFNALQRSGGIKKILEKYGLD